MTLEKGGSHSTKSLKLMFSRVFASRKRTWIAVGILAILAALGRFFTSIPMTYFTHHWGVEKLKEPNRVRILAVGDTGSGNENQRTVGVSLERACLESPTDGIVLLGDNFYNEGVESVDDIQWQSKFLDMYNLPCLRQTPFFALLGNHDYRGKPKAQINFTEVSEGRWVMPARAYALTFGKILGIGMIDSNFPDACGMPFCSLNWVKTGLQENPTSWELTAGHHPLFSGGKYKEFRWPPAAFVGDFVCNSQSRIYLAGHDHNLQHLKGKTARMPCEIDQLIIGGGGASLNDVEDVPGMTQFKRSFYGFAEITATEKNLRVVFRDGLEGKELHAFERFR